jgi:hypothetical protein
MRMLLALGLLVMFTVASDARARIRVTAPVDRSNAVILCPYVAWSVPPDTPNGHYSLGICPNRNTLDYCVATGKGCWG